MIAATTRTVLPCPPWLIPAKPIAAPRATRLAPTDLAYLQCSQRDVDSLQHFATDFLCFHPLTDSFLQNRGVGGT